MSVSGDDKVVSLDASSLAAKPEVPLGAVVSGDEEVEVTKRMKWYAIYLETGTNDVREIEADKKFELLEKISQNNEEISELLFVLKGHKFDFRSVRKFVIS